MARPCGTGWGLRVEPVGAVDTLLARLLAWAEGGPVALGVDFPIGLPRGYVRAHVTGPADFPAFLAELRARPAFFEVADTLAEVSGARPFYPRRGVRGMTRASHAAALGLDGAAALSRVCDRATAARPAGAPLFWTLGANQSGKAAIVAWRDLLLPALGQRAPLSLWPFEGGFRGLLAPGRVAVAETYPAEALRQLGLKLTGSKRRQADRARLGPALWAVLRRLEVTPDPVLAAALDDGLGAAADGEDRLDCVLGVLCVLLVVRGERPDCAPADPWIRRWEGWVLGQRDEGGQSV